MHTFHSNIFNYYLGFLSSEAHQFYLYHMYLFKMPIDFEHMEDFDDYVVDVMLDACAFASLCADFVQLAYDTEVFYEDVLGGALERLWADEFKEYRDYFDVVLFEELGSLRTECHLKNLDRCIEQRQKRIIAEFAKFYHGNTEVIKQVFFAMGELNGYEYARNWSVPDELEGWSRYGSLIDFFHIFAIAKEAKTKC